MAKNYIDLCVRFVPCVFRIRRFFLHLVTLSILKPVCRVLPLKNARGRRNVLGLIHVVHQTPRRIKNAAEINGECTLIWKHTGSAGHELGMKMLNINIKDIYHDQFNNSNIHSIN